MRPLLFFVYIKRMTAKVAHLIHIVSEASASVYQDTTLTATTVLVGRYRMNY